MGAAEPPPSAEMPRGPGPAAQRWSGRGQRSDVHRAAAGMAHAGSASPASPVPPRFEAPAMTPALAPVPAPSPRAATSARPTTAASAAPNPTRAAATPGETMTSVKRPTLEQLKSIVSDLHMSMSDREVAEYLEVLEGTFLSYDRIAALPMSAQWWKRIFLGNAMDVDMDGTGRVLISPELRAAAGITRDTMLLGMGNHFELWDKATYDAQEAQAMQGDMPDVFKDFSF
jgi:MraZ protein